MFDFLKSKKDKEKEKEEKKRKEEEKKKKEEEKKREEQKKKEDKVTSEDFEVKDSLGKGSFGYVVLCRRIATNKFYAMKIVDKKGLLDHSRVQDVFTERNILTRANHPYLMQLHWTFQSETKVYFVMDYMPGGDLDKYMNAQPNKTLDLFTAKLYDLRANSFVGSPYYVAPDVLRQSEYTDAVDFWSFGVLLFRMLCGRLPFTGRTLEEVFNNIMYTNVHFPSSVTISAEAKDLIMRLLAKQPQRRLQGAVIKDHPFWTGISWDDVMAKKVRPPRWTPIRRLEDIVDANGNLPTSGRPVEPGVRDAPLLKATGQMTSIKICFSLEMRLGRPMQGEQIAKQQQQKGHSEKSGDMPLDNLYCNNLYFTITAAENRLHFMQFFSLHDIDARV
eukprot:gene9238-6491_t